MLSLLTLLLGVVAAESPAGSDHPDSVEVFSCSFEQASDVNHDHWPDHWKRWRSPRHPTYLKIEIADVATPTDNRGLKIEMNGGAALIHSPPIPISPLFSYQLEADMQTVGLTHSQSFISVSYYDVDHQLLALAGQSQRLGKTQPWTKMRVGPFSTSNKQAAFVVISLHVEPTGEGFDLSGAALFDNIYFARLPRMTLRSSSPHNVFTNADDVQVTCAVSGIQQRDPPMTFELLDLSGRVVAEAKDQLNGEVVPLGGTTAAPVSDDEVATAHSSDKGYQGEVSWHPPIDDYGFYRVRVRMLGDSGVMDQREMSLVVVRPSPAPVGGQFGWSLPDGDAQLSLNAVADLLKQVGTGWVKFPLWYDEHDRERADKLAHFTEQLNTSRIELVGVIDQPPPEARKLFSENTDRLPAVSLFDDPAVWYPAISPMLTRLSLKVQAWQLGADDDTSFMGHPRLADKIAEIDEQMERLGQKTRVGLPWRWLNEAPEGKTTPWDFLSLTADPQMTADEIAQYLQTKTTGQAEPWVMLQPLPKSKYSTEQRARDLALRMLAATMHRASAIFASNPFDAETGLMNPDGTPGELLLPWRTTASLISGTELLGSITMPGGSTNYILSHGDQAVMVVWNETPTEEVINLGDADEIEHVDLWGHVVKPSRREHRQVYKVGPMPTFITGVNREMALWRMQFDFVDAKLQSQFGRPQFPRYQMQNRFRQGVGGTMQVHTPENWGSPPPPVRVNMSTGEQRTDRFEIVLRSNATSGEEPVRVDFDLTADRDYKFSLWRKLEVGLGDVVIEFRTRFDEDGSLIVEQRMINKTDEPVYFKCYLFPPGRRRLRQNVLNLTRGTNLKVYTLPEADDLIGQTLWVRAEEIHGERVLNYRLTVEP